MYTYGIASFVRLENKRAPQAQEDEFEDFAAVDLKRVDEELRDQQELRQLRMAIQSLSEVQQQVIGLYLDEDLNFAQIGQLLEMPDATVRSHIHRAKQELKKILKEARG
jgi:RNA polymerase sigma factor (sigma-70 family)